MRQTVLPFYNSKNLNLLAFCFSNGISWLFQNLLLKNLIVTSLLNNGILVSLLTEPKLKPWTSVFTSAHTMRCKGSFWIVLSSLDDPFKSFSKYRIDLEQNAFLTISTFRLESWEVWIDKGSDDTSEPDSLPGLLRAYRLRRSRARFPPQSSSFLLLHHVIA